MSTITSIAIDENIPGVEQYFAHLGQIIRFDGRHLAPAQLKHVDALIVRSVTKVNQQLLQHSTVGFVGTATIGIDHVDRSYLASKGIVFASAPGCNANSVKEYVMAGLAHSHRLGQLLDGHSRLGIVGLGNVGLRLAQCCEALGIDYRGFDPLVTAPITQQCDWPAILQCDVISLHTPLTFAGDHPTYHLFGRDTLAQLVENCLLINTSRGAVVDNRALSENIQSGHCTAILDVWEGEPDIMPTLLQQCCLATPHIAGYSMDGKLNGTRTIAASLNLFLGRECDAVTTKVSRSEACMLRFQQRMPQAVDRATGLAQLILSAYDIGADDRCFGAATGDGIGLHFDRCRREYPARWEFAHTRIDGTLSERDRLDLEALRFEIAE